jgi:hypothetical protein
MFKLFGKEVETLPTTSMSDKLFNPSNIKSVGINGFRWSDGEIEFTGFVSFMSDSEHGTTEGKQEFTGTSVPDVYNKMINFCNNL